VDAEPAVRLSPPCSAGVRFLPGLKAGVSSEVQNEQVSLSAPRASLVIDQRFRGPTRSANGGYTAGSLAELLADQVAEARGEATCVSLRLPPPLETPLSTEFTGTGVILRDGDEAVAEADPGHLTEPPPGFVPVPEAAEASTHYPGFEAHPFPECFTCGTARETGDGLRIFPGQVGDHRCAAVWKPSSQDANEHGVLPATLVWAALDCPSAWSTQLHERPLVLARMTARIGALPLAHHDYVVVGECHRVEGRKTFAASALYDTEGTLLAASEALWIAVDPKAFNALR
jgi:hypothetical protein